MAATEISNVDETQVATGMTGHPWRRLGLLSILLAISIGCNIYLLVTAPSADSETNPFVTAWLISFLPYLAACMIVLVTKPQVGRLRWVELGLLLVGALILRIILLPV